MRGFGKKNQSKREKILINKQQANINQLIQKAFEIGKIKISDISKLKI